ncbi:MAG: FHA domain-containing protein [Bdellovibrio sp.]|nr:MAG: FHA domain-containing protein [Bdellovibrio sp.]
MAKLSVFKNGLLFAELELQEGQEYIIGRGTDAQVILEKEKGISRHHIRLYHDGNYWIAELLSKHSSLIFQGEPCEAIELSSNMEFASSVYSFRFEIESQEEKPSSKEEASEKSLIVVHPAHSNNPSPKTEEDVDKTINYANEDQTLLGPNPQMVAFLRVLSGPGEGDLFEMKGVSWTVGRDEECSIQISHPNLSRKHFEISKEEEKYYLIDLKSSNGTYVNDKKVDPDKPVEIKSGDTIRVKRLLFSFEIRNQQQIRMLQEQNASPSGGALAPYGIPPSGGGALGFPGVVRIPQGQMSSNLLEKIKTHKIRVLIALLGMIFLYSMLFPTTKTMEKKESASKRKVLTKEQLAQARILLQTAQNHYINARYVNCIDELKTLHSIIPVYENSRELLKLCQNGYETILAEQERERMEKERRKNEALTQKIIHKCRQQIDSFQSEAELDQCLSPVFDINPSHPAIDELKAVLREKINNKLLQEEQQRTYRTKVARGYASFKKCEKLYNEKKYLKAIDQCQKYLSAKYPEQGFRINKANSILNKSKETISHLVSSWLNKCNSLFKEGKYKEAYLNCQKIVKRFPANQKALDIKRKSKLLLQKKMKSLYEDAVLEESMGGIEGAKSKFLEIVHQDIKGGKYYIKAKSKLKKYGEEL